MADYLELLSASGRSLVPLEGRRVSVGRGEANDVCVADDPEVSHLHAVIERYTAGWSVRDVGSLNGTVVNGERIWHERPLRDGDEIRIGRTRLVFKGEGISRRTQTAQSAPPLTRREHEVLVTLCKPLLSGSAFTEPASVRDIAKQLYITEAAVKKHIGRLYDKFGIVDSDRRRLRLANDAISRGAVSLSDLADRE